jgi:hypothetical protein
MRPRVPTVRALTTAITASAVACALLGVGTVTAEAAQTQIVRSGTGSPGDTGGWNPGVRDGHHHDGTPAPTPSPRPRPTPTPSASPSPAPRPRHTPPPGRDQDGQLPPVFWLPRPPAPPAKGTTTAVHPTAPPAPHARPAAVTHHGAAPPRKPEPLSPPAAMVLALAASTPLTGMGARLSSIAGVVPLPGWGPLRATLLSGPAGATGVLGGLAVAGSAVIGLGAYLCTRLRRRLISLW